MYMYIYIYVHISVPPGIHTSGVTCHARHTQIGCYMPRSAMRTIAEFRIECLCSLLGSLASCHLQCASLHVSIELSPIFIILYVGLFLDTPASFVPQFLGSPTHTTIDDMQILCLCSLLAL